MINGDLVLDVEFPADDCAIVRFAVRDADGRPVVVRYDDPEQARALRAWAGANSEEILTPR